jgi:hypothetical protein
MEVHNTEKCLTVCLNYDNNILSYALILQGQGKNKSHNIWLENLGTYMHVLESNITLVLREKKMWTGLE